MTPMEAIAQALTDRRTVDSNLPREELLAKLALEALEEAGYAVVESREHDEPV